MPITGAVMAKRALCMYIPPSGTNTGYFVAVLTMIRNGLQKAKLKADFS
jgi:hypothetical protein